MSVDVILNYEKFQIKDILVKKIQELRLKARDIDDFKHLKEAKREIKEYQDYLDFIDLNEELKLKKIRI